MIPNITDRAKKVLDLGRQEAQRFGDEELSPEHVLLGLLREDGVAPAVLAHLGIDRQSVARQLDAEMAVGPPARRHTHYVPDGPRTTALLEEARKAGKTLGHSYVGTEHILLALTAEESRAARVLRAHGLTRDNALATIELLLGQSVVR